MRDHSFFTATTAKIFLREWSDHANSLIILAATLFIFIIDLHLPLGVAAGAPYVLVIFASLWIGSIGFSYFITALCLIFTIAGFYLSPGIESPMHIVLINRGLTTLLIIATIIMVTRIKRSNIDISSLMNQVPTDPITGYKNRHSFDAELEAEILRCRRYHRHLSIAIVDIDLFKLFSDNYNYHNKNDYIQRISNDIRTNIRATDHFYRIDINVFAILFPETELSEAKKVCESIRKKISMRIDKDAENKILLSIGIATLEETDDQMHLCKRAEDALFISKRNGGNQVSTLPSVSFKEKPLVAAILSRSRID
ncbi:GGDEF domain-containing protein [Nitrosomonas sp.]|uniref:GGDEF domain-containing protein n=1 Tax=Nitrosomonas sp. TaxID=42353 RepID=UPI001D76C679|nr:GGDEF domain-containing protein [Nitrosomonas sp.]MBX3618213.1 GGDEF domain-containing protein [Nitrosomonas sp.]